MTPSTIQGPPSTPTAADPLKGAWRLDEGHSTATLEVPSSSGGMTVKGHFDRFGGTLNLAAQPALELIVDAESLDTANARREHLLAGDFFAVEEHPEVRFASDSTEVDGDTLKVRGHLYGAGESVPVEFDATLHADGGTVQFDAVSKVDRRGLGMTWSPFGLTRSPATLIVRGRLVRDSAAPRG